MTLYSIHMSDTHTHTHTHTYFTTQEPMKRVGQPIEYSWSNGFVLRVGFEIDGYQLGKRVTGLELRMWGTETRRYSVLI